jgi:hypothetical protein
VSRYIAETTSRLNERLADVSSDIRCSLEEDIPELRGDAGVVELLGASVEVNVDTILPTLQHNIAVQRVEAPAAALEHATACSTRRAGQRAVRAYRLGQRRVTELVIREVRALDWEPSTRFAVIEDRRNALRIHRLDFPAGRGRIRRRTGTTAREPEQCSRGPGSGGYGRRKAIDIDAATTSIRYPLRWHHLALVM